MVTGEQVKTAALAAKITHIPHHACGLCGEWVSYTVADGNLFFNPACGCSWSPPELREWSEAADFINMQTSEEWRTKIMRSFGMAPAAEIGETVHVPTTKGE